MLPSITITGLIEAARTATNGTRPDALRALGDALARMDAAALVDARRQVADALGLRLAEVDALRADALARREELQRADRALQGAADGQIDAGNYRVAYGLAGTPLLRWRKRTADGTTEVTVAEFVPRVVGERIRHRADGETVRVLTLEVATARGVRHLGITPDDLADPKRFYSRCVSAAGADARITQAGAAKHLPLAALELADPHREITEVYEFVGWHEHGGRLVYLSASGPAIGAETPATVDLSAIAAGAGVDRLARFGPRDDGDEAFARAAEALAGPVRRAFPDRVTLPGLAAVFLAPLLRFSPAIDRPGLHYVGATGARKSQLLGVLQAFYGLPEPALSWRGTANSIEIALSSLRDALVTVDDLKAGISDKGAAVKILQSYADRRGRSRATRSGELAQARIVGGLLVSAGEDIPSGEASVAARSLFIRVEANDADLDLLTQAQEAAPVLGTLTARYIAWLANRQDQIAAEMVRLFVSSRAHYRQLLASRRGLNDAGRVAVNCALLEAGAAIGCQWLQSVGWRPQAAAEWLEATRGALERLAYEQAEAISEESAALAFLRALQALLDSRRVELVNVEVGKSLPDLAGCSATTPGAVVVGWRQGETLWLQPDLVLAEVKNWQSRQGQRVDITKRGLYAQLRAAGWLAAVDADGKTEVVKWINGRARRVLALRAAALGEGDTEEEEAKF